MDPITKAIGMSILFGLFVCSVHWHVRSIKALMKTKKKIEKFLDDYYK